MTPQIDHDPTGHRFHALIEGRQCVLDYELSGTRMTITHTQVPAELGGRGIAAELTRVALATARAKGWQVVPACSYAAAFMARHPEYSDLLA